MEEEQIIFLFQKGVALKKDDEEKTVRFSFGEGKYEKCDVTFSSAEEYAQIKIKEEIAIYLSINMENACIYGFLSEEGREFESLISSVPGCRGCAGKLRDWAKKEGKTIDDILFEINCGNDAFLVNNVGIGQNTANRLVNTLKGKIKVNSNPAKQDVQQEKGEGNTELVEQLISLGFSRENVYKALNSITGIERMEKNRVLSEVLKLLKTMNY